MDQARGALVLKLGVGLTDNGLLIDSMVHLLAE